MNSQRLIAKFRRVEVVEGVTLMLARDLQQEIFEAIAEGDPSHARTLVRALVHDARLFINREKRRAARSARHEAMTSLGLTRVRGNLGGTYYE